MRARRRRGNASRPLILCKQVNTVIAMADALFTRIWHVNNLRKARPGQGHEKPNHGVQSIASR